MRAVVQKVKKASVKVSDELVGSIKEGLLVLIAVHVDDTEDKIKKMAEKLINLRVFEDNDEKMNLSIKDKKGEFLIVSQFTLYGNVSKGNRPSFIESARPEKAEPYYEKLVEILRSNDFKVETGKFGNLMEVDLINHGPTTIIIDV